MPTLIDELVVTLGLDGSKFRSDADRTQSTINQVGRNAVQSGKSLEDSLQRSQNATDRRLKQTAEVGRVSAQTFNKFRIEAAALFSVLATGAGLTKFVQNLASTEAATGRTAKNLGMATRELSLWQEVAKQAGGTGEGVAATFQGINDAFQQTLNGQPAANIPYLQALHAHWSDDNGNMVSYDNLMRQLHEGQKGMARPRADSLLRGAGVADPGLRNALMGTDEEFQKYITDATRIGVLSDENAEKAIKFEQSLARMQQSFMNLKWAIGGELMPVFEHYMDTVTEWLAKPENQKFVAETVHEDIKKFGDGIIYLIDKFKQWQGLIEGIAAFMAGRWLLAMTVGLGPVGVAVAIIAAGFLAIQKGMEGIELPNLSPDSPLWAGVSVDDQLKYPQSPESRKRRNFGDGSNPNPYHRWNPGSWLDHPAGGSAAPDLNDIQRGFLDTISGPESGGRYDIKNGGSTFSDFGQFPAGVGPGGTSTASGRYQITQDTWSDLQKKYGFTDFKPETQDWAAWMLASERYRAATGGDLEDDLKAGKTKQIADALKGTWSSLPGGAEQHGDFESFDAAIKRNSSGQFSPSKGFREDVVDPVKNFFKRNFGGSPATPPPPPPLPPPAPDPGLKNWTMGSAQRDATANNQRVASNTSTVETNINGPINLYGVQDAEDGAKGFVAQIKRASFASQANTGLV